MLRFLTTNRHKFDELRTRAEAYDLEIEMVEIEYEEIQAPDLAEIALQSAHSCRDRVKGRFFLEDSGLFVNGLNGFPGPYSSYVFSTLGIGGILDLLKDRRDREAKFKSVICYFDGEGYSTFRGSVSGEITREARGSSGFGFDPIFIPMGHELTFAEMGPEKNRYSHRSRSAEKFFRTVSNVGS